VPLPYKNIFFVYVAHTRGSLAKEMCITHGTTNIRHLLGVCFYMVEYLKRKRASLIRKNV